MIVKNKMQGVATKKHEVTGIFRRGGFSSKSPIFEMYLEELKIRLDNNQNIFLVLFIGIYKIFNHFKKKLI